MRERFAKWNIWIKGLENRPQRNQQGFPPHEFTPVSSVSLARARETDPLPDFSASLALSRAFTARSSFADSPALTRFGRGLRGPAG